MLQEIEEQATSLDELIDIVERDNVPTNIFTIEDNDPMVILGKLNEVIAYLETLRDTISDSDTKANQALESALTALTSATEALSSSNNAIATANSAISTANSAIYTANEALQQAQEAVDTATASNINATTAISTANDADGKAERAITIANGADSKADTATSKANSADSKADTAISTANTASSTATLADHKADNALSTASTASSTASEASSQASTATSIANSANTKAEQAVTTANEALAQVVTGGGTKVYVDGVLQSTFDADTKANKTQVDNISTITQANVTSIANINTKNTQQDGRLSTLETMTDDISEELETQAQSITNISSNIQNINNRKINNKSINQENITLYGNDIKLASDNEGGLTDAIIGANVRIDNLLENMQPSAIAFWENTTTATHTVTLYFDYKIPKGVYFRGKASSNMWISTFIPFGAINNKGAVGVSNANRDAYLLGTLTITSTNIGQANSSVKATFTLSTQGNWASNTQALYLIF